MPTPTVSFATLRNACVAKGLHARLNIFDGGENVEIRDNAMGRPIANATAEYGDGQTATQQVAAWLVEHGYLTMQDFEG